MVSDEKRIPGLPKASYSLRISGMPPCHRHASMPLKYNAPIVDNLASFTVELYGNNLTGVIHPRPSASRMLTMTCTAADCRESRMSGSELEETM